MRGRALLVVALAAGLLAPTAGAAVQRNVSVKFQRFTPHQVIAVTGDTVMWKNNEVTNVASLANHNLVENSASALFNSPLAEGRDVQLGVLGAGDVPVPLLAPPGHARRRARLGSVPRRPRRDRHARQARDVHRLRGRGQPVDLYLGGANLVKSATASATTGKFSMSIPAVPGWYQAKVGVTTARRSGST